MKKALLIIKKRKAAFILLGEAVTAALLIAFVAVATVSGLRQGKQTSVAANELTQANNLTLEGIEIIRDIRMADFFALKEGSYALSLSSDGNWELVPESIEQIGDFTREVAITAPYGPLYPLRQAEVIVSWPPNHEIRLKTEFKNWTATFEDWSTPFWAGSFDLTSANSGSNNHKVKAIQTAGKYLYIGNDHSAGKEFLVFDLINAPDISIEGSLDLNGSPRDIAVYQNFAFIASTSQTEELQVIDVSDSTNPALAATADLAGNDDALSIDVNSDGTLLAIGRKNGELYIFDIAIPQTPTLRGSLALAGSPDINDLQINGSVVLLALSNGEVAAVDISNPDTPSLLSEVELCGEVFNSEVSSIVVSNNTFYAGCKVEEEGGYYQLVIGDVSDPYLLYAVASVDVSSEIKHLSLEPDYEEYYGFYSTKLLFALTEGSSDELQIFEIFYDYDAYLLSSVDLDDSPSQIVYSPLVKKAFIGFTSNPELQIVAPTMTYTP